MLDENENLTKEDRQWVKNWMAGRPMCATCGNKSRRAVHPALLRVSTSKSGSQMNLVLIECGSCNTITMLNVPRVGIV